MAFQVLMPRQGNTVESCIILEWKKQEGDTIKSGDIICEVETDKAAFEVEAPADGTLLKIFFNSGDDVPVLTPIAAIGNPGEDISFLNTSGLNTSGEGLPEPEKKKEVPAEAAENIPAELPRGSEEKTAVSPRAKKLARSRGIDYRDLAGTGPEGRIIERDIQYVLSSREPLSPAALGLVKTGMEVPASGSGIGGRVLAGDLTATGFAGSQPAAGTAAAAYTDIPVKGVRKIVASRMLQSVSTTAQLTMNTSAEAAALLSLRKRFKEEGEPLGLSGITINDLVLFAVARVLPKYPDLNAHFLGDTIRRFGQVNLGFAVDTPKGLLVPVIRGAERLSLKEISLESRRLVEACQKGSARPEELSGGSFTVTNLGALGIESFTPVLNIPEVAILDVCSIQPKAVMKGETAVFKPHMGLTLTINHQAVDGAPGARFLQELVQAVSRIDMLLAG
ncbi:MAG: 2-oxo acid dehydrogenase subunit E2 [Spirochaetales bacterium]|nr:MAG: 2-oxo acid dehydrogenase subunit E2 [Spirochaetales bacterium]